jgi:hypothetical protein
MIKSRRMRWTGYHKAWKMRSSENIELKILEERYNSEDSCRWDDSVKMDVKETGW